MGTYRIALAVFVPFTTMYLSLICTSSFSMLNSSPIRTPVYIISKTVSIGETLNTLASPAIVVLLRSGILPFSYLAITESLSPSLLASSACVIPASFLNFLIFSPIVIFPSSFVSIIIFHFVQVIKKKSLDKTKNTRYHIIVR